MAVEGKTESKKRRRHENQHTGQQAVTQTDRFVVTGRSRLSERMQQKQVTWDAILPELGIVRHSASRPSGPVIELHSSGTQQRGS